MVLCKLHKANLEFILSFDEIIMAAKFYEIENYQTQKIKILNINIRWDRLGDSLSNSALDFYCLFGLCCDVSFSYSGCL